MKIFVPLYLADPPRTDALTSTQAPSPSQSLPSSVTSPKWHTQISINHSFNLQSESRASENSHCGKGDAISSAAGDAPKKGQTIIGFV